MNFAKVTSSAGLTWPDAAAAAGVVEAHASLAWAAATNADNASRDKGARRDGRHPTKLPSPKCFRDADAGLQATRLLLDRFQQRLTRV